MRAASSCAKPEVKHASENRPVSQKVVRINSSLGLAVRRHLHDYVRAGLVRCQHPSENLSISVVENTQGKWIGLVWSGKAVNRKTIRAIRYHSVDGNILDPMVWWCVDDATAVIVI